MLTHTKPLPSYNKDHIQSSFVLSSAGCLSFYSSFPIPTRYYSFSLSHQRAN
jgi:hypothetical protein